MVTCGLREETGTVSAFYVPAIDLAKCFPHMAERLKVVLVILIKSFCDKLGKRREGKNFAFIFLESLFSCTPTFNNWDGKITMENLYGVRSQYSELCAT